MGGPISAALLLLSLHLGGFENRYMTIRFPKGVIYIETCVYTLGWDAVMPTQYHDTIRTDWTEVSCWKPRFSVEDYKLRRGAYWVRVGIQFINEDGSMQIMYTPNTPVRPEPDQEVQ